MAKRQTLISSIPMGWDVKKLGELCNSILSGRNNERFEKGVFPVYGSTGVIGFCNVHVYNKPSILIARVGANAGLINKVNGMYDVSDNALILMPKDEYDISFAHYQLTNYNINRLIFGSGQPLITAGQLKSILLPIPPFSEQQKIATLLNTWDTALNQLKIIIENIKSRNKELARSLLTGKKRLKGYKKKWKSKTLDDFLIYTPREVVKPKETFLSLGIRSHGKGVFHKKDFDPDELAMDVLYKVETHDLIVNITFAWEHAIAIAEEKDAGGLVSHRFPTYTFRLNIVIPSFFKYFILQSRFRYMLENISPGGAGRNRVMNKKDFLKLEVIIPNVEEQTAIADILGNADKELKIYEERLNNLQVQKKGLMQILLTGKKRLKC